jgi:hypothetical protein
MKPSDWAVLCDARHLVLAFPGIVAGVVLTLVARKCDNEAMLPLSMVLIPATFYVVLLLSGMGIDDAREGGWVGEKSPPVPVRDLFHLVDFGLVRWGMAKQIISTWAGKNSRAVKRIFHRPIASRLIQLLCVFSLARHGIRGFVFLLLGCRGYIYGHGGSLGYQQRVDDRRNFEL